MKNRHKKKPNDIGLSVSKTFHNVKTLYHK